MKRKWSSFLKILEVRLAWFSAKSIAMFVDSCGGPFVLFLTWTRFATPGTRGETKNGEVGRRPYLALDGSRCAKQRVASGRLCNRFEDYSRLLSSRGEDEDERRRPGRDLALEPSSTSNQPIIFKTRAHSQTPPRRSRAVPQNVHLGRRLGCPRASAPLHFQTAGHRAKERCRKRASPGGIEAEGTQPGKGPPAEATVLKTKHGAYP